MPQPPGGSPAGGAHLGSRLDNQHGSTKLQVSFRDMLCTAGGAAAEFDNDDLLCVLTVLGQSRLEVARVS